MSTDATEQDIGLDVKDGFSHGEIPLTLKEFGEIPRGYVPVYVEIAEESLQYVAEHGLRISDNRMIQKNEELEKEFIVQGRRMGVKVDRTKCVFAYPRHPDKIFGGSTQERMQTTNHYEDPKNYVLLEAMINPNMNGVLVADAEYYTEAAWEQTDPERRQMWIKTYWETTKSLPEYLKMGFSDRNALQYGDFVFPEILIPEDIPTSRLRVVPYLTEEWYVNKQENQKALSGGVSNPSDP